MNFWNKVRSACAELSPNCREAVRALSEALDRPLPPAKRFGLWMHLLICKWCRRYGKQIRFLRDVTQEHPVEFAGAERRKLSPEARERIKQRLADQKDSR
ncbi:MAG: hypothetical protein ABSH48_10855 [Verrucomicrobiota bacterium]|jgi:hypothetical protein